MEGKKTEKKKSKWLVRCVATISNRPISAMNMVFSEAAVLRLVVNDAKWVDG
jgi:hypothetical protein